MPNKNNSSERLKISSDALYQCKLCGKCCTQWDITLSEKEFQNIKKYLEETSPSIIEDKKDWFTLRADINNPKSLTYALALKDGRCIFMDDENLCFIHKNLGYDAKFKACKAFPRSLIKTPNETYVSSSFACSATLELLFDPKRPFKTIQTETQRLEIKPIEDLRFFEDIRISWGEYQLIEDSLMDLLTISRFDFEERLCMVNMLLWKLCDLLKKPIEERELKPVLLREKNAKFENIYKEFKEKPASAEAQLQFLLSILAKRIEGITEDQKVFEDFLKIKNTFEFIRDYFEVKEPTYKIPNRKKLIEYWRMNKKIYKSTIEKYLYVFIKYIQNKIFGKILFCEHGIINGFHFILIQYVLIRLLLLSALIRLGREPQEEEIKDAIYLIEKTFDHTRAIKYWIELQGDKLLKNPYFGVLLIKN